MEGLLILFGLGVLATPFVLSVVALANSGRIARLDARLNELTVELARLQQDVTALRSDAHLATGAALTAEAPTPAATATSAQMPSAAVRVESAVASGATAVVAAPPSVATEAVVEPSPTPAAASSSRPAPQSVAGQEPTAAVAAGVPLKPRRTWNVEEALGRQIFLWAGVAAVSVGVLFLLYLAAQEMGAAGKVTLGFIGAGVLFGVGFVAERRERYRQFGRPLIAGGCAIAYFVTFAMHFIPAARLIDSEAFAVTLLLAAGGLAVALSLRYRHEWTTTLSFLLIFLALGIAAAKTDATFNLVATTTVAAALAFLVWRLAWDRLLALGVAATWVTLGCWLLPNTWARTSAADRLELFRLLLPLVCTWLAFGLAVVLRRAPAPRAERWQGLAALANMIGGFGLAMHLVYTLAPPLSFVVALAYGAAYLGAAVWLYRRQRRLAYLLSATMGLMLLGLVSPLRLGFGSYWVPSLRLFGIELLLLAGVLLKERYFRTLAYLVFLATMLEVLLVKNGAALLSFAGVTFHHRLVLLAGTSVAGFVNVGLLRRRWRAALCPQEIPGVFYFFSTTAAATLWALVAYEVRDLWMAPVVAALSLCGMLVGNRYRLPDFAVLGTLYAATAVGAVLLFDLELSPSDGPRALRPIIMSLVALSLALDYVTCRRWILAAAASPRLTLPRIAAVAASGLACVVVFVLLLVDVPHAFVAPAAASMTVVLFYLALRYDLAELLVEGVGFTVFAAVVLVAEPWQFPAHVFGVPARLFGAGLTLALWYLAEQLLERFWARALDAGAARLVFGSRRRFFKLVAGYLILATLGLVWSVKHEAMAYDKNLLVALLWGVAGVVYLEISRLKGSPLWWAHGHGLVGLGALHLFLVSFVQGGTVGPVSLRALTVLPFLLVVLYVYNTFASTAAGLSLPPRARGLKPAYLYLIAAIVAGLSMYELMRAWVIVAWALLALAMLWRAQGEMQRHWRRCALILVAATVVRTIGVNLYFRDEIGAFRLNLATVPLAALGMVVGYGMLRRAELREPRPVAVARSIVAALRRPVVMWLSALVVLATGFVVVEAEGTILTVWLSVEGAALVGLGFAAKERLSRLLGLWMLCFCILKLFIYDLRDLSGVPRIMSFIGLGLALIAVSFAYTRFKERLAEIL
ncbi:MAG: DUF2339 domain-containing protein [Deltaproteobacteria bacterium]|nr:DUF2339 domain-containing protein [Deltaproteobacteria bacterium]